MPLIKWFYRLLKDSVQWSYLRLYYWILILQLSPFHQLRNQLCSKNTEVAAYEISVYLIMIYQLLSFN